MLKVKYRHVKESSKAGLQVAFGLANTNRSVIHAKTAKL